MKKTISKVFRNFLQGLLALLPVIVTVYVAIFLFKIAGRLLDNILFFLPYAYRDMPVVILIVEAVTIIFIVLSIASFGLLVRTLIGKALIKRMDALFNAIPGVSTIYRATRQLIDIFASKKDSMFTRPVLVEWPTEGTWSLGFNTGTANALFPNNPAQTTIYYSIFIPTTPNPTSGFLTMVPAHKVRQLDMTVEHAVKIVLTGGMVK